jgi:hypothetical protein
LMGAASAPVAEQSCHPFQEQLTRSDARQASLLMLMLMLPPTPAVCPSPAPAQPPAHGAGPAGSAVRRQYEAAAADALLGAAAGTTVNALCCRAIVLPDGLPPWHEWAPRVEGERHPLMAGGARLPSGLRERVPVSRGGIMPGMLVGMGGRLAASRAFAKYFLLKNARRRVVRRGRSEFAELDKRLGDHMKEEVRRRPAYPSNHMSPPRWWGCDGDEPTRWRVGGQVSKVGSGGVSL